MLAYLASGIGLGLFHQIYQVRGTQFPQALERLCSRIDRNEDILLLMNPRQILECQSTSLFSCAIVDPARNGQWACACTSGEHVNWGVQEEHTQEQRAQPWRLQMREVIDSKKDRKISRVSVTLGVALLLL